MPTGPVDLQQEWGFLSKSATKGLWSVTSMNPAIKELVELLNSINDCRSFLLYLVVVTLVSASVLDALAIGHSVPSV